MSVLLHFMPPVSVQKKCNCELAKKGVITWNIVFSTGILKHENTKEEMSKHVVFKNLTSIAKHSKFSIL